MERLIYAIIELIVAVVMILIIGAILAFFVMLLWNWLMPVIFGLKPLTLIQAWGLTFLCSILFKSSNTNTTKRED